jgi:hypothetical protein
VSNGKKMRIKENIKEEVTERLSPKVRKGLV